MNDMEKEEEWKSIPGYEGLYDISNHGRVRSWINRQQNRRLKPYLRKLPSDDEGYLHVNLYKNAHRKTHKIAPLVLKTFSGSCPLGCEASHINGIKTDNRINNLIWEPHLDNVRRKPEHRAMVQSAEPYNPTDQQEVA